MFTKRSLVLSLAGALFLAAALAVWAMAPSPAHAQCEDIPPDSTCITCHEKEAPVDNQGEWHVIHATKDCCASCHGGNCKATDKDLAHQGMVAQPLEDVFTSCYHCHPDDYPERASRFGLVLGVNPGSHPTPTTVPAGPVVEHPMVILPPSIPVAPVSIPWPLVFGSLSLTALVLIVAVARHTRLNP